MRIDLLLLGGVRYTVPFALAETLFLRFCEEGISPKGVKRDEKGEKICFWLPLRAAKRFEAGGLEGITRQEVGLQYHFRLLLGHPALLVGLLLGLLLFGGARMLLWDIRITGNEQIGTEELEGELGAVGVVRGCFLPGLDTDAAEIALREGDGRLAYVSINKMGTVIYVQVREGERAPQKTQVRPANLVARCDGVVTMPLVFEGECVVKPGEIVRAGQLLASGVLDTQHHGYRLTRAAGQVLARTTRVLEVYVPFCYEQEVQGKRLGREMTLLFFNSARKIYKNSRNITVDCDIIEEIRWFTLPGGKRLPLGISQKSYFERACIHAKRSAMQARSLAFAQLDAQLAQLAATCTPLNRHVEVRSDAQGIALVCTLACEEDIAVAVDIKSLSEDTYGTRNRQNRSQ